MPKVIYHICGVHDGNPICFSSDKEIFLQALSKMKPLDRSNLVIREAQGQTTIKEITAEQWLRHEKRQEPKKVIKSEFKKLIKKYKRNDDVRNDLVRISKRLLGAV